MSLHWLSVDARIVLKILIIVKCLHRSTPSYLVELFETYDPVRELCFASQLLSTVFKSRTKKTGNRSFYVCSPKLYNDLFLDVGYFMSVLLSYTTIYL